MMRQRLERACGGIGSVSEGGLGDGERSVQFPRSSSPESLQLLPHSLLLCLCVKVFVEERARGFTTEVVRLKQTISKR